MCGLVGIFSSNMMAKHKDLLSTMLYFDTLRGRDSTGVAAIRANADTHIIKSTVPGYEFVEGGRLDHHLKFNDFCWIGHNRFGTVGKNIKSNAHPFEILDEQGSCILVGAHNGTLKNKHALTDHGKFGTDSEALFNEIAVSGVEKAIEKVEGAWAITYYDHLEEELRVLRNKERSLFYAYEKGKKTLIWASEIWMIKVGCARHGVELEEDKIYAFSEDTLYKFPAPDKLNDEITMERQGGLVGKTPYFFQQTDWRGHPGGPINNRNTAANPPAQSQTTPTTQSTAADSNNQAGKLADSQSSQAKTTQSTTQLPDSGETPTKQNEDSFNVLSSSARLDKVTNILTAKRFKGYAGELLTLKELEDQLDNGCAFCQKEHLDKGDKYGWLAPGQPVCDKCLTGGHEEVQAPASASVH